MLREQILTIAFLADFFQFFQNNSNNTTHQSQKNMAFVHFIAHIDISISYFHFILFAIALF